jgi:cell division protein FtsQ
MKKWMHIALGFVAVISVVFLMAFSSNARKSVPFSEDNLSVSINDHTGMNFIDQEDILEQLYNLNLLTYGAPVYNLSLAEIEQTIKNLPHVAKCAVYTTIDGKVYIDVTLRKPIARVIHKNGMSNYIDADGHYVPTSRKYTAHVPVFTGEITESANRFTYDEIIADSALTADLISDDIFQLADFIRRDEFLSAQIEQVVVDKNKDFILIPKVGDHKIVLGGVDDLSRKFSKLKVFYSEGLKYTDWNQFDTINLKYKDQIVCTKK